MPRRWSSSVLVCLASCGASPSLKSTAKEVAVPLTAASASHALVQTQHTELAPWSLTASDGSGLELARVEARAVLAGPLAFTELHLDFHNAEHRQREGTFQITLPAGAGVTRFAMQDDQQRWLEAEVVERMLARRSYEDVLHRRQDPALLETAAGNQFSARVFPIPANADKHLVISYVQRVPGGRYVLPLRGLPQIARLDVELAAVAPDGKTATHALNQRDWRPDRDFAPAVPATPAVIAGVLVAAEVTIATSATADAPRSLTLLVDTSASRAAGFAGYVHRVRELVAALAARYGDALAIELVAFDQDSASIYRGPARELGAAAETQLLERGAAGASDLERAVAGLHGRVVIVTDGVVTAGLEGGALVDAVKARAIDRLDVVLAGGIRDDKLAARLAHDGAVHRGAVLDLDAGVDGVVRGLGEAVQVDVPVAIAGAAWSYPQTIAAVQNGDRVIVYGRLAKPARSLDIRIGATTQRVALASANAALVDHAIAAAQLDELERQLAGAKPDVARTLRAEILKRSIAARIVSSQTAMLVLETDDDYARYGIRRDAPPAILSVGDHGLAYLQRQPIQLQQLATPPAAKPTATKSRAKRRIDDEKVLDDGVRNGTADGAAPSEAADEGGVADARTMAREDTKLDLGGGADLADPKPVPPAEHERVEPRAPAAGPRQPVAEPRPPAGVSVAQAQPRYDVAVTGRVAHQSSRSPSPIAAEPAVEVWPPANKPAPLSGELANIERALARRDVDAALAAARDWHARAPGDVLALVALGDALEAKHAPATAARVYGSIIDLFPNRADLRRFAGERLERLGAPARWLAIDTYRHAVADRADHVSGHRLLAYALVRDGQLGAAFAEIMAGLDGKYPIGRFAGADRVLADDAAMIGAAVIAREPSRRAEITAALRKHGLAPATEASTRFVLYWETDVNDVDLHVQDARGNHAWYSSKVMPTGGELYADVTTGYGPECFAMRGTPKAGPYHLTVDYYSQGPMGYGMGLVQVQRFDGKGRFAFDDRPFVVMTDHAVVDLGTTP